MKSKKVIAWKFSLSILLLSVLLSCKKDHALTGPWLHAAKPTILSRTFYYPNDQQMSSTIYREQSITATATILEDRSLRVDLGTSYADGRDDVSILIPPANLKPGYVGLYPVKVSTSPAYHVYYRYRLSETLSHQFLSGRAVGVLEITNYDAVAKTISGIFSYTIVSAFDPMSLASNNLKTTHINFDGSFSKVAIN